MEKHNKTKEPNSMKDSKSKTDKDEKSKKETKGKEKIVKEEDLSKIFSDDEISHLSDDDDLEGFSGDEDDNNVVDEKKQEKPDVWEDIYGRKRDKEGNIIKVSEFIHKLHDKSFYGLEEGLRPT